MLFWDFNTLATDDLVTSSKFNFYIILNGIINITIYFVALRLSIKLF